MYESFYIVFDFINILCDMCITELFVLCALCFDINDKIKVFNQTISIQHCTNQLAVHYRSDRSAYA